MVAILRLLNLFLVHKLDSNQCPSAARQVLRVCITQGGAPSPKTYRAVGLPVAASCPPRLVPYLALLSRSRARRRQGVTRPAPCRSSRCCRGAPSSRASARPRFRLLPCPGRTCTCSCAPWSPLEDEQNRRHRSNLASSLSLRPPSSLFPCSPRLVPSLHPSIITKSHGYVQICRRLRGEASDDRHQIRLHPMEMATARMPRRAASAPSRLVAKRLP